jgi:hypothetical protein
MRTDDAGISACDDSSDLLAEVAKLVAGDGDIPALLNALRRTRLYCVRLDHVGFAAIGPPGAGMVPVFTSEEELARYAGACDWFSGPGSDVLDLLPPGYDLALDLAGPHPVRLHAAMWAEAVTSIG